MYLSKVRSKHAVNYYACSGFRVGGKVSTRVVARLGSLAGLCAEHGFATEEEAEAWCRRRIAQMEAGRKDGEPEAAHLELVPGRLIGKGRKVRLNAGFMVIRQALHALGFAEMTGGIMKGRGLNFDLGEVIERLVYARILDPLPGRPALAFCKSRLLDEPSCQERNVQRALGVLCEDGPYIQSFLSRAFENIAPSGGRTIFYDCMPLGLGTQDGARIGNGAAGGGRPGSIAAIGLFTDDRGVPLGFDLFEDGRASRMIPPSLEKRLLKGSDRMERGIAAIACNGLPKEASERISSLCQGAVASLRPLCSLDASLRRLILEGGRAPVLDPAALDEGHDDARQMPGCWRAPHSRKPWRLDEIEDEDPAALPRVFFTERSIRSGGRDERLVAIYSPRRRERLLKEFALRPGLFWPCMGIENFGFCAAITSIPKGDLSAEDLALAVERRSQAGELLEVVEDEFKSPGRTLSWERACARATACFMAQLASKLLELRISEAAGRHVGASEIASALGRMDLLALKDCYTSGFARSELTDLIGEVSGMRFDVELMTEAMLEKYEKLSRKPPLKRIRLPYPACSPEGM